MWVNPNGGKTARGEPVFIKGFGKEQPAVKPDYVYGPGTMGFGFYHFLTRESYHILYARLRSTAPSACCSCFNRAARQIIDEHDDVMRICYNRSVASVPDDLQGAKDAEAIARGTAKTIYNFTQNEQLFIGGMQTAFNFNLAA